MHGWFAKSDTCVLANDVNVNYRIVSVKLQFAFFPLSNTTKISNFGGPSQMVTAVLETESDVMFTSVGRLMIAKM